MSSQIGTTQTQNNTHTLPSETICTHTHYCYKLVHHWRCITTLEQCKYPITYTTARKHRSLPKSHKLYGQPRNVPKCSLENLHNHHDTTTISLLLLRLNRRQTLLLHGIRRHGSCIQSRYHVQGVV